MTKTIKGKCGKCGAEKMTKPKSTSKGKKEIIVTAVQVVEGRDNSTKPAHFTLPKTNSGEGLSNRMVDEAAKGRQDRPSKTKDWEFVFESPVKSLE